MSRMHNMRKESLRGGSTCGFVARAIVRGVFFVYKQLRVCVMSVCVGTQLIASGWSDTCCAEFSSLWTCLIFPRQLYTK